MNTVFVKLAPVGLFFVLIFVSGFWLSHLGRPYSALFFNVHKLIALAGIVFSISLLSGYGGYAPGMELDAIASVVIGGTMLTGGVGNVIGTLFGVLINGTIVSILQFNGTLSSWWTRIGVGALTLIFIGIQSLFYMRKKHS